MARKQNNYWKDRFETIEAASNAYGQDVYKQIEPTFNQAQREVQTAIDTWYTRVAKNNQVSIAEARKLLSAKELAEFKWDVKEFIKYGEENALDPIWMKQLENASAKYHISRLEALKIQTQQSMEKAFGNELDDIDVMARKLYTDDYYHSAYEIQKGLNVGWDVSKVDVRRLDMLISKPWAADGKNFSDRIWQSKTSMVGELHNELVRTCILGKSPDEAIRHMTKFVDKKFSNAKMQAGRLVMTEQAFFASAAQKDCFNELDVEEFEVVATLDSLTSAICQEMDGKHFPMQDYVPGVTAPPFHVWCRSTTVPFFDDEWSTGERAARGEDGKTYFVPESMKYNDWKKSFADGGSKDELKPTSKSDIIKNIGDAKDWNSLSTYMQDKFNITIDDSVRKLDFETSKRSLIGIESMFDEFPDISNNVQNVITSKSGVMSCTGEKITFNHGYYSDSKKLLQTCSDMEKIQHWVKNVTPESIGVHEAAHGLEWVLLKANSNYTYDWQRVFAWNKCSEAKEIVSLACKNIKKTAYGKGKVNNELINAISHYATDSASETMAEAFADIYANKENANPFSIEIKKLTIEKLKQYKGGQ